MSTLQKKIEAAAKADKEKAVAKKTTTTKSE